MANIVVGNYSVWCGVEAKMKMARVVFLLCLFWSLVHCQQTFPYVSFMGQTLANHSYVDLSLVGTSENDSVQCHTDLKLYCSSKHGPYRGDWYFLDGKRLPLLGEMLYERRGPQRVDLRRASGNGPTGIYRCDIPTEAVHNITNTSVRATVYVRLYTGIGGKCSPHL